jgi:hypothetical protein
LAVVVGFVFGNVEPFPVVVHTGLGVNDGEPFVVAFLEFGKRFFAGIVQGVQVVVEGVAFDRLARWFAQIHRDIPLYFGGVREFALGDALKRVEMIAGIRSRKVQQQRANGVGFGVE